MLGEKGYGGTPRNIPNLEVKPVNAESTWREASWEDRNLPSFFLFFEDKFLKCFPIFFFVIILYSSFYEFNLKKVIFY